MNNEPVAWIIDVKMTDCDDNFIWNTGNYPDWQVKDWIPLYIHPVKDNFEEGYRAGYKFCAELYEASPVKEQSNPVAWRSQDPDGFIKVFGEGKQVWCKKSKYRRVSVDLPVAPPGWSFVNPGIIYKIINLDTKEYQECTGDLLPPNHHKMSLCKNGKQTLYCITLKKNICIDRDTLSKYGIPINCSTDTPIRRRRV